MMRTEVKIALGLFATNSVFGQLLTVPEFVKGMLLGLSIFLMIIGLLPETIYRNVKNKQVQKLNYLKELFEIK
ncbi:MAG: hypothetical protein WC341_04275 [Bacteroidales bacterium]|jgi:hypothetical protein